MKSGSGWRIACRGRGVTGSVERLVVSPISSQLDDGIRDERPSDGTDRVPDHPQLVNPTEGSAESVGAEVVQHRQGRAPSFHVVELGHGRQLTGKLPLADRQNLRAAAQARPGPSSCSEMESTMSGAS